MIQNDLKHLSVSKRHKRKGKKTILWAEDYFFPHRRLCEKTINYALVVSIPTLENKNDKSFQFIFVNFVPLLQILL